MGGVRVYTYVATCTCVRGCSCHPVRIQLWRGLVSRSQTAILFQLRSWNKMAVWGYARLGANCGVIYSRPRRSSSQPQTAILLLLHWSKMAVWLREVQSTYSCGYGIPYILNTGRAPQIRRLGGGRVLVFNDDGHRADPALACHSGSHDLAEGSYCRLLLLLKACKCG